MNDRTRHIAAFSPVAIAITVGLLLAGFASSANARTVAPLPASDYTVRAVCSPPAPGQAGCLALQLVPQTTAAREHTHPLGMARPAVAPTTAPPAAGAIGLRPQDLHSAYQLPSEDTSAQTVALVDAYNDPTAESDLKGYDEEFGLPECTAANGCFSQLNGNGKASPLPFPKTTAELEAAEKTSSKRKEVERAIGWGGEISLDIETVHAICQNCKILLLEAETSAYPALETAERSAARLGATEISNSWGGPEEGETPELESLSAFDDPGTVITASAGDDGYLGWAAPSSSERGFADFPASSPHVVAVGGTHLEIEANGTWAGETVWNGDGAGGGGCSTIFEAPLWQQNVAGFQKVGCRHERAVADVSADADPYTGLAVHDTSPDCSSEYEEGGTIHELQHWCTIGGTSLASPLIASVFALAGGAKGAPYPARTLYQNALASPGALHDVTSGSNGVCSRSFQTNTGVSNCTTAEEAASCSAKRICLAGVGYDGPTGLGTPDGLTGFTRSSEDEAAAAELPPTEEEESEASNGSGTEGGGTSGNETEIVTPVTPRVDGGWTPPASSENGTTPIATTSGAKAVLRLTSLSLTKTAVIALNRARPKLAAVGFSFTLTAGARLRATLVRRIRKHGHSTWSRPQQSLSFAAAAGSATHHFTAHGGLTAGLYRLTLTPTGAPARSIEFRIG